MKTCLSLKKLSLNTSLFKEFPKARFMPSNGDCKIIYKSL